jgi:tRNA nucleotidyltransferase (CCA-adding enzyme)
MPQDPIWHPEGDAFQHTCCTVDAMADIMSREDITGDRRVLFLLTMICHDMGKAVSTHFEWRSPVLICSPGYPLIVKEGKQRWVSPGHDVTGVPIARSFLKSINASDWVMERVLGLVRWHMAHTRPSFTMRAVRKLGLKLTPASLTDLLLVMEADCKGRGTASSDLPKPVMEHLVPIARDLGFIA